MPMASTVRIIPVLIALKLTSTRIVPLPARYKEATVKTPSIVRKAKMPGNMGIAPIIVKIAVRQR